MKPYQVLGYAMLQTTAITAITSTRVYHGLRPQGTDVPCINYFELPGTRRFGVETQPYSINCRAATAAAARDLARHVVDLFAGEDGTGIYGTQSTFTILRGSLSQDQGLIPEPEDSIFNAPVDITIVYGVDTVT